MYIVIWNKQKTIFEVAVSVCSPLSAICSLSSFLWIANPLITNNPLIVQFCATVNWLFWVTSTKVTISATTLPSLTSYHSFLSPPPTPKSHIRVLLYSYSWVRNLGIFSFPLKLSPKYLFKSWVPLYLLHQTVLVQALIISSLNYCNCHPPHLLPVHPPPSYHVLFKNLFLIMSLSL